MEVGKQWSGQSEQLQGSGESSRLQCLHHVRCCYAMSMSLMLGYRCLLLCDLLCVIMTHRYPQRM